MKNLIVIIGTCVVLFIVCVLVLMPLELGETQSEVSVIKLLPADYNPYQRLYDKMLTPTVRISSASGIGSGVVIETTDKHRLTQIYILTANHVVGNNTSVTVTVYTPLTPLNRGELSLTASVVMTDTNKDLALIRIETTNQHELTQIYSAKLAPKDYTPYLFSPVWVVGCSLGLNPRPSFGHITAIDSGSFVSIRGYEISAPILPGNSGGPVFDGRTHELIGIAVWVHTYQGQLITTMAGVVPVQEIHEFLNHKGTKDTKD